MIPERYVLMVVASALLLPWAAIYMGFRRYRQALVWSSLFALPFGLSEILFAGDYWEPPTLFDLSRRIHLDIESFVFLFGAGGVAGTGYNVVTGKPVDVNGPRKERRPRAWHGAALGLPAVAFPIGLAWLGEPIVAGIVAMTVGVMARVVCRPDLSVKTILGALLFSLLYLALVASLVWIQPGYIDRFWSHEGVWLMRMGGIPLAEILFGASFGAYWSGLYEQWRWTMGRATSSRGK